MKLGFGCALPDEEELEQIKIKLEGVINEQKDLARINLLGPILIAGKVCAANILLCPAAVATAFLEMKILEPFFKL